MDSWTIKLPRTLSARVTRLAKKRHVSRSALVREALEALTSNQQGETFLDRVSAYVGVADDLPPDLSTNPKYMKDYGR